MGAAKTGGRHSGRHVSWKRARHVSWKGKAMVVLATGMAASVTAPQAFAGTVAISGVTSYDPATDPYSMAATDAASGATSWWAAGVAGQGIDVAVIDTGVAPVAGLDAAGKVVNGPDLALDAADPTLRTIDENGHGTFMAGLIAGNDPVSGYRGVAPQSRIVNLKVGVADGEVDVSQVIAAIDWVVQNKTARGLNIRVLSLSYGTNSTQSPGVDPLAYAVEQAWKAGIVVVSAAGNTGFQQGAGAPGLADPGYDPYVITAGGYDTMGTAAPGDDTIGTYSASSSGCATCKAPDLVAVGSHLQGMRVPGGYVDLTHPEGRLGDQFFRGSGTSEATAVTAGAAALLLSAHPDLTPDQVKAVLTSTARPIAGAPTALQGAGELNLTAALAALSAGAPAAGSVVQTPAPSTGLGSLEAARGTDHVDLNGTELDGERDVQLNPWSSPTMATDEAGARSWKGAQWNKGLYVGQAAYLFGDWPGLKRLEKPQSPGETWTGKGWQHTSWSGTSWSGTSWSGTSWSGSSWSGTSWSGTSWSGTSWSGSSWSGSSWSSATWS